MKRLFDQGPGPALRAFVLLLLAVGLMMLDRRVDDFHQMRNKITAVVAYPFQLTIDTPIRFLRWLNSSVTTQQHLLDENAKLRANDILLTSQLHQMTTLQKENAQLRSLLQSTAQVAGRVQVARLLAVGMDPNLLQVVIDKGSRDHVYNGQPVLDAYGVLGQVISRGPLTSKVLLITDQHAAVPVKNERNGMRAVAEGLGLSGELVLIDMPANADVKVGDVFVASGLGLRFPIGYPVGQVVSINKQTDIQKTTVVLAPMAHINQAEQVLLSWPHRSTLRPIVQAQLKAPLLVDAVKGKSS